MKNWRSCCCVKWEIKLEQENSKYNLTHTFESVIEQNLSFFKSQYICSKVKQILAKRLPDQGLTIHDKKLYIPATEHVLRALRRQRIEQKILNQNFQQKKNENQSVVESNWLLLNTEITSARIGLLYSHGLICFLGQPALLFVCVMYPLQCRCNFVPMKEGFFFPSTNNSYVVLQFDL